MGSIIAKLTNNEQNIDDNKDAVELKKCDCSTCECLTCDCSKCHCANCGYCDLNNNSYKNDEKQEEINEYYSDSEYSRDYFAFYDPERQSEIDQVSGVFWDASDSDIDYS